MFDKTACFEEARHGLLNIAYRMLGTLSEAEDLVQETWLRWDRLLGEIDQPKAWLTTVVTRLAIDYLRSARVRREHYTGPWLPEPVPTPEQHWQTDNLVLAESLSMAMLHLLERLSPSERAAFLLRDVFDVPYERVADILEETPAYCRKLVSRARGHLNRERPRYQPAPGRQKELEEAFGNAAKHGDLDQLLALFHEDITLYCDGGGRAVAALRPIYGADRVSRFFTGLAGKLPPQISFHPTEVNGGPGLVTRLGDTAYYVLGLETRGNSITAIRMMRNPDKLNAFAFAQ